MKNYKAVVEYDGTDFCGFQAQPNGLRTVEGEIVRVLSTKMRHDIKLGYAGRTDAGVHALGQVINFKSSCEIDLGKLKWSLNSMLSDDIVIKSIEYARDDFDSRRDARLREYSYQIVNDDWQSVFLKRYSILVTKKLDIDLMKDALDLFLGVKDFRGFCSPNDANVSKIRSVYYFDIEKKDNLIIFKIGANAFLYNMARIIIGSVLEAGLKKRDKASIAEGFSGKGICFVQSIVPPKGLFLTKVQYP